MDQEGAGAAAGGASSRPADPKDWYRWYYAQVYGSGCTDWRALYGNAADDKWHEVPPDLHARMKADIETTYARDLVRLFGSIAGTTAVCVLVAVALIRLFLASTKYIPIP